MAACQFHRTFAGSAVDLVNRARNGVQAVGGTLTGDATHGTFSITKSVFGIARTVAGSVRGAKQRDSLRRHAS